MKVHHIAYLVKKLDKAEKRFLDLGYSVERPVKYDHIRKINIEFLVNGDYRVELVEPVDENSPMYSLLKKYKNTPYHMCYEVADLERSIKELSEKGFTVFQSPEIAPCIDDKRVAFLINASVGMIELVEI